MNRKVHMNDWYFTNILDFYKLRIFPKAMEAFCLLYIHLLPCSIISAWKRKQTAICNTGFVEHHWWVGEGVVVFVNLSLSLSENQLDRSRNH